MAENQNNSSQEKTEKPTQRKLDKAREEGKTVTSKEMYVLSSILMMLALFYFVAIPTVIRSRLTTDTSGGTSLVDQSCELIEILESDTGLVKYKNTELRVYLESERSYKKNQDYVFFEKDGNLYI